MPQQTSVTCYRSARGNVPAINVKVRRVRARPSLERDLDGRDDGESIRQTAYELAQEGWWHDAKEIGVDVFGIKADIEPEGSSGGWLIVAGIGDPEFWAKKDITRWERFEGKIQAMLAPKEITSRYSMEIENLLTENE